MSFVSTALKVHYNQKLGGSIRPFWGGERTMASGGIDALYKRVQSVQGSFVLSI